jgi:gamma-glutamylcyclotransferase (GGCT)/AIG2-like uncharacterized protein YtfP
MYVFTYGSLMFPQVWRAVVGRDFPTVEGNARGFAIFRVRDDVFPGIAEASDQSHVRGVVYLDVDEASLMRLDQFEGDFYERRNLPIDCDDGARRNADAYVVPVANLKVLTAEPWDRDAFVATGGLEHFISRFQGFSRLAQTD